MKEEHRRPPGEQYGLVGSPGVETHVGDYRRWHHNKLGLPCVSDVQGREKQGDSLTQPMILYPARISSFDLCNASVTSLEMSFHQKGVDALKESEAAGGHGSFRRSHPT